MEHYNKQSISLLRLIKYSQTSSAMTKTANMNSDAAAASQTGKNLIQLIPQSHQIRPLLHLHREAASGYTDPQQSSDFLQLNKR